MGHIRVLGAKLGAVRARVKATLWLVMVLGLSACTSSVPAPTPSDSSASPQVSEPAEQVPTAESTSMLPPVEQPTPSGGPWRQVDVTVTTADEAESAAALPETLRTFLASRVGVEDSAGCTLNEVSIQGVHEDGYAFGAEVSSCGGASHVVWGITENQWHYLVVYADPMPCADIAQNEVPPGTPGLRCTDDNDTVTDY